MRRPPRGLSALTALAATLAAAAPTLAAETVESEQPITLTWSAVVGCPDQGEVRAEIERVLGGPPSPASRRYLRAQATVSSNARGGFHVHLVTDLGGVPGERDLDGPTCAAVARAAALIVALTFDPEALTRHAEAPPLPSPPPLPPPTLPAPPPQRALPYVPDPTLLPESLPDPGPLLPPNEPRRVLFAAGVIGTVSLGDVPKVGAAIGGRLGILVDRFRADLSFSYWPDQTATLATLPAAGGHVHLLAGAASGCWAVLRAPVELSPCLGVELGSMAATGFGVSNPGSGSALWVAPLAQAAAAFPFAGRFAARLDLSALVPVLRPPFVLTGSGTGIVYTTGPVVGRATLGVEARF